MDKIINNFSKYLPHFLVASFIALLGYLGFVKEDTSSYIRFNLDENSYVHADDPSVDSGCGSSGDGGSGDGGGDA